METKNNFVMGAAVALVGSLVGAGAVVSANLAFQGHNPNWAKEQRNPIQNTYDRGRVLRQNEGVNPGGNIRDRVHNAAEKRVLPDDPVERCNSIFSAPGSRHSTRYTHCIYEALRGRTYQLRQTTLPERNY